MSIVTKTVSAIEAMNKSEQALVIDLLRQKGLMDGPVSEVEKTGGSGRKGRKPYWLKTIDGWVEGKKGGYGIDGRMAYRPSDLANGTMLAMRVRDGDKTKWGLMIVKSGESFEWSGSSVVVSVRGVTLVGKLLNTWDDFKNYAKAQGVGG